VDDIPPKYLPLLQELEEGEPLTKRLAEAHGFTYSSVYSLLRRRNLLAKYHILVRRAPDVPADWEGLVEDMKTNGLSINSACEKYSRKYDQVYHFLKYRNLLEVCGVKTRRG
jgi:hypothetical protein